VHHRGPGSGEDVSRSQPMRLSIASMRSVSEDLVVPGYSEDLAPDIVARLAEALETGKLPGAVGDLAIYAAAR